MDNPHCFKLLAQELLRASFLVIDRVGSNIAANMPIIAITTKSSIRVNLSALMRLIFELCEIIYNPFVLMGNNLTVRLSGKVFMKR